VLKAFEELLSLGALNKTEQLTEHGRKMALFPLDPKFSKVLLSAADLHCSEECITIISLLSADNIIVRTSEKPRDSHTDVRDADDSVSLVSSFSDPLGRKYVVRFKYVTIGLSR
jgi:HrpA-like RNA helicase